MVATTSPEAALGVVGLRDPVAQLLRAREVEVAPRAGLALVAELLERVGLQPARRHVVGLGEHEVVHELRGPAVLAAREGLTGLGQQCLRPPGELRRT